MIIGPFKKPAAGRGMIEAQEPSVFNIHKDPSTGATTQEPAAVEFSKWSIAIDGVAGAGKGTLARALAEHYKCQFLPTGNLYRLLARKLLEHGADIDASLDPSSLKAIVADIKAEELLDATLADEAISKAASKIAVVAAVREALNDFQRKWAYGQHIAILEGRDIGTVIFPNADVKLFLTADAQVRAERRAVDLKKLGHVVTTEAVLADLLVRDARDQGRTNSPLKQAPDAIVLDTTILSTSEMTAHAIQVIDSRISSQNLVTA